MAKLIPEQTEQFYRVRLDPYKMRHDRGMGYRSICPLHGGSNPTQLWVDIAEGNYCCFSCGAKGGSPYAFEQAFLKAQGQTSNHDDVMRSLAEVLGTPFLARTYPEPLEPDKRKGWNRKHARDFYRYTDELGEELFTVWRFVDRTGRKLTPADRPCPCRANPDAECPFECTDGRMWITKGVRRVLYRLPDVINSSIVFVVEGEKNCNDLSRALAGYIKAHGGFPLRNLTVDRVAVTTNPGGAGAWKKEYVFGPYFFGKVVIKLGDNDRAGRLHDQQACEDIAPYALKLFTLKLPVGEGADISDFLADRTIDDLLLLLPTRVEWRLPKRLQPLIEETLQEPALLVKPSELVAADAHLGVDWLVDGLIERGTRGLVVGPPKTGKSLLFLEMVLCLATGKSFLGLRPYHRPVRCAIVSREDGPTIVHRRLSQLAAGKGQSMEDVDKQLLVNTESQSATFKIDVQTDLEEMAAWLRREEVEFVVIDVLNRLHSKQENSSDDMTQVMQKFDELGRLGGCQVCVIAHTNKSGDVKGSTSIAGWPDYIVRLEQHLDDEEVKILLLKTKLSGSVQPRTIRYWQSTDQTKSRIQLVEQRPAA